ncbi:MAG: DUF1059 domain-containing protein [candidate division NC10 bacterium]|nr:DUF1059 domain-containing protein [candidate division NC10 bacterium]
MAKAKRVVADCRRFPSEKNCSLTIAGTEKEVLEVAEWHAVKSHGHKKSPELRKAIRGMLEPEK